MHEIGADESQRLDIVPAQYRVIVTRRPKFACRACPGAVAQAPAPERLIKGGLPTERIIALIPRLQATAVLSTTSFGTYLADRCQELTGQDATALGVRALLGGGEPGMGQPEIRDKIIRGWGLERACEVMGLGDVMALLWAECEAGGGMHFCGQRSVAVELIDPASGTVLPWEEGVRGEAVYTTFAREATPVLRYRSADHLVVTATSCPCGRTSPRIRCVSSA